MKTNTTCLVLTFLLAGFQLAGADASSKPQLNADKPELVALLRANYVDYDKIRRKSDDLQDLIAQSRGGLSVAVPQATTRMFSTNLPGNVVYWRAESFTPSTTWADLAAQANQPQGLSGLILDLRSNTTPDDFAGALQVASFMSAGKAGLMVHDSKFQVSSSPMTASLRGQPTIIVLTNHQTRGAAEALAACLKARGALVMGEATEGKAAVFKEVPLASGGVLRYAAAHVYLADGTDLWDHPVVPDVTTGMPEKDETNALALIDQNQVTAVIGEAGLRHRMSEAALVHGQDPEQDEFLAAREKNGQSKQTALPATRDIALVEALDSLKAIHVLQAQDFSNTPTVASR